MGGGIKHEGAEAMILTAHLLDSQYCSPIMINPAMVAAAQEFGRFTIVNIHGEWIKLGILFKHYYAATYRTSTTKTQHLWANEFNEQMRKDLWLRLRWIC